MIFIFGGYNKEHGTLSTIERYDIARKRIFPIELKMLQPLRRFATIKISSSKVLILGGIGRLSKDSDAVYCFDSASEDNNGGGANQQPHYSMEILDKIERAGAVD